MQPKLKYTEKSEKEGKKHRLTSAHYAELTRWNYLAAKTLRYFLLVGVVIILNEMSKKGGKTIVVDGELYN